MVTTKIAAYTLPVLPYPSDGLEPVISKETIKNHHGKHLAAYVNNLNKLIPGSEYEGLLVEEIVQQAPDGPIYNNAGQAFRFHPLTRFAMIIVAPNHRVSILIHGKRI